MRFTEAQMRTVAGQYARQRARAFAEPRGLRPILSGVYSTPSFDLLARIELVDPQEVDILAEPVDVLYLPMSIEVTGFECSPWQRSTMGAGAYWARMQAEWEAGRIESTFSTEEN